MRPPVTLVCRIVTAIAVLTAPCALAPCALAVEPGATASEPTIRQIYAAAESGHLDQAHDMITRVLKNHPDSAKAHYVAAEIDARQQNYGMARDELKEAEKLAPGLPFASAKSVQKLKLELARESRGKPAASRYNR